LKTASAKREMKALVNICLASIPKLAKYLSKDWHIAWSWQSCQH